MRWHQYRYKARMWDEFRLGTPYDKDVPWVWSCLHYAYNRCLVSREVCLADVATGRRTKKWEAVSYADVITILVTRPEVFNAIHNLVGQYEQASGEYFNPAKSKALAGRQWQDNWVLLSTHRQDIRLYFSSQDEISGTLSCRNIVQSVRAQAKLTYLRKLCLTQRVQYVNTFLLAKLWYTAQILPPTPRVQQLVTKCNWFIWQGAIFRVPASILHQPKIKGGGGLLHLAVNCRTLLLYLMRILSKKSGQYLKHGCSTSNWLTQWKTRPIW
jgi:hypothetical protein